MDNIAFASECLRLEAQAILDLIPKLDDNFNKAVDLIYNCKGRLIITGVGKSGHVGAKIAATMASTGTPSFFVNPLDAYHGDLGMFTADDVVLAISYSGNTDELLRFIPLLKQRDIKIIGMSGNPSSLLGQNSDCHINIAVEREACPLNLAPTSSTTATLAMGDALACVLIKKRNFTHEDFAVYHPGGSLGRKLLAKVKNHMVATDLPTVEPSTKISDAIIKISDTKLGVVIVMEDDKILGIVTDGDIRRAMQNRQDQFFDLTVSEIMTRNPKMISEDAKLAEAEEMMRQHHIHTLIVTDSKGRLCGVIDTFHCN